MREHGWNGLLRGRAHRTTIPGKDGVRAGDLLNRDFRAEAPNRVWVADFTYVVNAGRKLTPWCCLNLDPPDGLDYLVLRCARVR
jgi:transposase InsO family protein